MADDLQTLKVAAECYVAAIKAVFTSSEGSNGGEMIAEAHRYAADKSAYYEAARKAMPILLQTPRGNKEKNLYCEDLREIFRGFGEDRDEEATNVLRDALEYCPESVQRDQALKAVEDAQEMAKRFVKDFGGLDGV